MPTKKFLARDCELSTTGQDREGRPLDSWDVTQIILAELPQALSQEGSVVWSLNEKYASRYSMDCLRHWSSTGQCYYSDMSKIEVVGSEVLRPRAFAAQCLSLLVAAERARRMAEEAHVAGATFALSAANIDVLDPAISWGSHLNVAVSNELWEDLFVHHRHPARLGYVASAMAAGIAFFGAGYLVPLKDGSTVFSTSARAHHLGYIHTLSTTEAFRRGILNTRREPHGDVDRLHLIGFDFSLISAALLATYVQCLLAAAEEGFCGLILYDPVHAIRTWSWNLDLRTGRLPAEALLVDGRRLTLPAYIRELTQQLLRMCEGGLLPPDAVPEAIDLLPRIIELTHYLDEGSLDRCARHLDWAAKLLVLIAGGQPLESAAARLADHDFSNTDPRRGTIWQLLEQGSVDPLIDLDEVKACLVSAPSDSRAWGRGELIRRFHAHISDVDWGRVELRCGPDRWGPRLTIDMPRIDRHTQADFQPILSQATDVEQLGVLMSSPQREPVARRTDPLVDIPRQLATSGSDDDLPNSS